MENYISVSDVANLLGVSRARVHQLINEPCRECGRVTYRTRNGIQEVTYEINPEGCEYCRWTGMRLPTDGRFGDSERSPYKIRREDVEKLRDRKIGFPKGKRRITK